MVVVHKIAGSEVLYREHLLPGYAALKLGPTKPWVWRWTHTSFVVSLVVVGLTFAGTHGMLP